MKKMDAKYMVANAPVESMVANDGINTHTVLTVSLAPPVFSAKNHTIIIKNTLIIIIIIKKKPIY